mmetsp:Transcript_87580/g.246035  ORF Transcript_87580/g.246035 Transcript_87580/m.246035 type:complete len:182 (+) Transcript_87580:95-640(+)
MRRGSGDAPRETVPARAEDTPLGLGARAPLAAPLPAPELARTSAADWRETCSDMMDRDKIALSNLGYRRAPIDHAGALGVSDRLALASGRKYPNRGRNNAIVKPPPEVPKLRTHDASRFAADCRAARVKLGLREQVAVSSHGRTDGWSAEEAVSTTSRLLAASPRLAAFLDTPRGGAGQRR